MKPLYYIHGKDSSSLGIRAQYLARRYPGIRIPDLCNDVLERRTVLEQEITQSSILIGSSLGGLTVLDFSLIYPQLVSAMVILAPAVGFFDEIWRTPEVLEFVARLQIPAGIPAVVLAARADEIIPIQAIRDMVARSPDQARIQLIELEDQHSLHKPESLDALCRGIDQMISLGE